MDKAVAIVAIADLIVRYGVPAAIKLIQTLEAEGVTLEDIKALKEKGLRPAAQYFDDNAGA
jgi:hypothetical protein